MGVPIVAMRYDATTTLGCASLSDGTTECHVHVPVESANYFFCDTHKKGRYSPLVRAYPIGGTVRRRNACAHSVRSLILHL